MIKEISIFMVDKRNVDDSIDSIEIEEEMLDEGLGDVIKVGTLLTLLAIPGVLKAEDLEGKKPPEISKTINAAEDKSFGGFSKIQASNIVARTLYMEARSEGTKGMDAVTSVLWNRAGGKSENLPMVCLKKYQFSCWNDIDAAKKTPKGYVVLIPTGASKKGKDQTSWLYCQKLAGQLVNGTFKSTIGTRNSYHTLKVSPKWSSSMKQVTTIGNHKFGYLPEYDGFKTKLTVKQPKVYVVKDGDVLSKIAISNKTTKEKLIELNPKLKKNPDRIYPGQKLIIPS